MNIILHHLKNLQEVDDRLRAGQKALDGCEERLKAAGAALKSSEDKLRATREELAKMRARHRELEAEVADLTQKRKNNEARQMTIKNANEYTALAREAEFLNGRINELEDETLELLDKIEKAEIALENFEQLVSEEAAAYGLTSAEIDKVTAAGRRELEVLKARREELVKELPAPQLSQYNELVRTRAGRAVAAASDGMCLDCRLSFPPQIYNELQRNEKISNCPNCGRIIYWREHPDFQTEA